MNNVFVNKNKMKLKKFPKNYVNVNFFFNKINKNTQILWKLYLSTYCIKLI